MVIASYWLTSCGGGGGKDSTPTGPPPPVLSTISVSLSAATLQTGQSGQAGATGLDQYGASIATGTVTWSSSAPSIATVSPGGVLSALSVGQAQITATVGARSGQSTLAVIPVPVASVTVTPSAPSVIVGATQQLTAATLDASNAVLTDRVVTWASSDTGKAKVSSSGLVTAVSVGAATIVATSEGRSGTATVTVLPVPVASVTVTPAAASIIVGTTQQLTAVTLDANNATLTGRSVAWTTSDQTKATVSSSGLVTGVGVGAASITATSEGRSGTATVTVVAVPVAAVTVSPGTVSLTVGATQQLSATPRDAGGTALTGRSVSWTSSDQTKATVTQSGLVTALAVGTATVSATSEGKQGTVQVTISASSGLSITGIAPTVLIEGATATITGTGFAAGAGVLIAGLSAAVQSVTSTQLQVTVPARDCQPQRTEPVAVTVGGSSTSSTATVKGSDPAVLNVGFFMWSGSTQCLQLAAGPAGSKYVIGILSTSATPSDVTSSQLFTTGGTSSSALASILAPSGPTSGHAPQLAGDLWNPRITTRVGGEIPTPVSRRDVNAEARVRQSEARLRNETTRAAAQQWLAASRAARQLKATTQSLSVGDTTTFTVQGATISCTAAPSVRAVVRYIGTENIWYEDVANPIVSFSTAEYQSMESFFASTTKPVLASYVGPFTDIDSNQRNLILITKEVNKQSWLLGFVWGGDLFPKSLCTTSNAAEIFYGVAPDTAGIYGSVFTKTYVSNEYRRLMAHEFTHVIQFGQYLYGPAGNKATWEMEGGATLTEQLVGFRVYGYASGQDLGRTQYRADTEWFQDWPGDLAFYYGFLTASTRTTGAPEQCTWIGRPSEGNSGPCGNANRAVYGVPATLLRYVLDKYGPGYAGGEAALARNIVSSANTGYASLTVLTGVTASELLTRFGLMVWSDGNTSNMLTSWNLTDIWSGFVATAHLSPYTSAAQLPTFAASVRAGSTAYLEWSPGLATSPMSLRVRTPVGGAVPATMVLWLYRYQ